MTRDEILNGETREVEFKVQRPKDSSKYMKTVVAFSNGEGGRIVFGVQDKTLQVCGIPREDVFSEMDAITEAISDSCEPTVIPDVYLQTIDGKTVIVVDISEGRQRPYYIKSLGKENGVYVRVSGTSRPADEAIIKELMFEGSNRSFDQTICTGWNVSDADIEDLCENMYQQALQHAGHPEDVKKPNKEQLVSWGILAERNEKVCPTNAFSILTGKGPIRSSIQCGVFKGNTRATFVDRREYTGPLWEQIDQTYDFVLRNIHLGATFKGIYRQDVYEIPEDAIRELIINAAVHRSYIDHNKIQVAVYDNRLEVTSPGRLPMGQTIEKMKAGLSRVRNEALANAFSYMNLIEQWGSGIPRIIAKVTEAGLQEPEFLGGDVDLRINIYRKNVSPEEQDIVNHEPGNDTESESEKDSTKTSTETLSTDTETANTGTETEKTNTETSNTGTETEKTDTETGEETDLTDTEKELIGLIGENPSITLNEMAEATGLSKSGVRYAIARLRTRGKVVREGSQKKGRWIVHEHP